MVASIKPRIRKGITYWPTYEEAEAQRIAAGATSVVRYALGYAVQWYPSGPYIGPEDTTHPHGRHGGGRRSPWCPRCWALRAADSGSVPE